MAQVLRGVILDVDGTLVDSNDAHARAWVEALSAAGHAVPFERVRGLIGMGGDKLLPEVCGLADDNPQGQAITKDRSERFLRDHLPGIKAFPGARELLKRMRQDGYRLVVGSSANRKELGPLLALVGGEDLVDETTSADDADGSKPDPDILVAALKKVGLKAAEALMLGDTPYDLEAATRAGVAMIGLKCGGWSAHDLAGATAVYADAAELLAHYQDSPLGERTPASKRS